MTERLSERELADMLVDRPLLLMLDIDGTLCNIVPEPTDAAVPERTRHALSALAATPDIHVALITGRSVADALRMTSLERGHIHGNHGLEVRLPSGDTELAEGWQSQSAPLDATADALEKLLPDYPGALLEHKRYSLSMHYRAVARGHVRALTAAVRDVASAARLRVEGGKEVLNILPQIGVDKGAAALRLVRELMGTVPTGSVLFAGDDVTDENAFRALARSHPHAVTVKVGGETATAARYRVDGPAQVQALLELLRARS